MFVSCVHPVAVLNAAFCMICSLVMLVEDARGDYMEEAYSRAGLMNCLIGSHECLLLFTPSCCSECFLMICRGLCACTEMVWMCVLYMSFGSKVRPRTFGCVAMGCLLLGPDCSYILQGLV